MKPRKNYRTRPKKTGAVKRQRILSQKRRLVAAGYNMEELRYKNNVEIRDLVKKAAKKKSPTAQVKKQAKKKTARKASKPKKKD